VGMQVAASNFEGNLASWVKFVKFCNHL
jgi:hypothetical protein